MDPFAGSIPVGFVSGISATPRVELFRLGGHYYAYSAAAGALSKGQKGRLAEKMKRLSREGPSIDSLLKDVDLSSSRSGLPAA